MNPGSCCCNVLWFILVGWHLGLVWCFLGLVWCITIVGIPFGTQAFKIGCFIFWPFGKDIVEKTGGADGCDCFLNFLWIIFGGLFLCIAAAIEGVFCFITIIGIPFGLQLFKLAHISLVPFGRRVIESDAIPTTNTATTTTQPIVVVQPVVAIPPGDKPPQYAPLEPPQYVPPQPQPPQYAPPQPQPPQYVPPPQYTSDYNAPNGHFI